MRSASPAMLAAGILVIIFEVVLFMIYGWRVMVDIMILMMAFNYLRDSLEKEVSGRSR